MSQLIEDVAVARNQLAASVDVCCHVRPDTRLGYTMYAADNRVTIDIGDRPGQVTLFFERVQLTRFMAVLIQAAVELYDSVDLPIVGGA